MLTKGESIEDFIEVTSKEKEALEKSDSEWTEPPRSFIDQWNSICGTFGRYNPDSGFFELNDVLDLTYEDALKIMPHQIMALNKKTSNYSLYECLFRTIVIFAVAGLGNPVTNRFLGNNNEVQSVQFYRQFGSSDINHMFMNCRHLKNIIGNIDIGECSTTQHTINAFYGCDNLEEVRLNRLRVDISFQYSPKLSLDSLKHIVANRITGSLLQPFTITVHPEVYAKLTDPNNEEWYQLNQDAIEKQITFVTV